MGVESGAVGSLRRAMAKIPKPSHHNPAMIIASRAARPSSIPIDGANWIRAKERANWMPPPRYPKANPA